ncbi:hypothetical protein [Kineococcus sp. R86509]|uniref:hypothetical protein n=1 Tax=Kineococcus sp. R86509 TaxID=3093851 RepID=UPI0036D3CE2E
MMKKTSTHGNLKRAGIASLLAVGVGVGFSAGPATAVASDAVRGCNADHVVIGNSAHVPDENAFRTFETLRTSKGSFAVKCGIGSVDGFGAVHIEVKHRVPNWPDALNCMKKVVQLEVGRDIPGTKKHEYSRLIPGTTTRVFVVRGPDGIVTAYPEGNNEESKWIACSKYMV